ncbi:MAG: N-acetylmuramic acid 6-phosphate etherase [Devosia nanyangense]|uniref:N-acetylmuramic acid 6-phosphate etherase n=1 Tax=Devosia nanyangense TaxID=1228055 RepID=A0A933L236_9HYPH|nr:N-acetylmuramic acid 6-phosphate etherase [Devosia nanyangense]
MPLSNAVPKTETRDDGSVGLDTWGDEAILAAILDGQRRAIESVAAAIPALSRAARLGAAAIEGGGRLVYLGAGSPALISLGDALEVPQTYGIPHDRIVLVLADGKAITRLNGVREDDVAGARSDIAEAGVNSGDCVIATSASGSTPYTLAGLKAARAAGARTIGITGNAGSPLFGAADVAVLLDAGPEVISGSTRMGAGTAQKAALNMLSTLIGIRLGHVHDGLMVNVKADNDKLRGRAARIVTTITGANAETAAAALKTSDGEVKPAILIAAGAKSLADAEDILGATKGNVRQALAKLSGKTP